jgi:hypothetical protein
LQVAWDHKLPRESTSIATVVTRKELIERDDPKKHEGKPRKELMERDDRKKREEKLSGGRGGGQQEGESGDGELEIPTPTPQDWDQSSRTRMHRSRAVAQSGRDPGAVRSRTACLLDSIK